MNAVILYGSRYGSTRRYAEMLSEQTGIPAVSYTDAPSLSDQELIVYLGGLYAGGVLGLSKTLAGFSNQAVPPKMILVTVGLSDPEEAENQENIRRALQKQCPAAILDQAKLFHLRGAIDYQKLSFSHRAMMALLYRFLRKKAPESRSAEDRAFAETYGGQADFVDFHTLEPIIKEMQRELT
ncbi:MAG TPA: flavodoxin domain-containing protein [Firmicutes bacterium]|nr:flavodoxin domain-containing protein [Bacillota bacterium]